MKRFMLGVVGIVVGWTAAHLIFRIEFPSSFVTGMLLSGYLFAWMIIAFLIRMCPPLLHVGLALTLLVAVIIVGAGDAINIGEEITMATIRFMAPIVCPAFLILIFDGESLKKQRKRWMRNLGRNDY